MEYLALIGWSFCVLLAILYVRERRRSARLEAEAAESRREALARTNRPAVLAHEIRTPLALVKGAGEILEEGMAGPLDEKQRQFLRTMTSNTQRVIDLAESLLTDLKLSSNEELATEIVDVREVVASTAREMRRIADVPIRVDAPGGVLEIRANAPMIRQLMWNLLNNSLRHASADGAVVVSVAADEDGGALIAVEDSGQGIPEDEQDTLFEPFTPGSAPNPGTGIGMMVAERIVAAHSGRIMVDSLEGRGTVVHVRLPKGDR